MMKRMMPLLLAVCLLLGGCASGAEKGKDAAATAVSVSAEPQQAPQTLVVAQMGTSVKTAMVILAEQMGYFSDEGLSVTFEQISNLNDAATALTEGKIDVLPYGMIPTCTFVSQGAALTVIGGSVSGGSTCVALAENAARYETPQGFASATVACVRPETGHMYIEALLNEPGVTDVTFVELDGFQSVVEAVKKGEADAGFVNAFTQTAVKQGLSAVFDVADWIPDSVCCRQTTSAQAIAEKRDALVRFETALLRAYQTYRNDKDTTVEKLMAFSGQDENYVRTFLYEDALIIDPDPAGQRVTAFYKVMQQNGDIAADTPYDMADHVDASIYEDALNAMLEREPDEPLWQQMLARFEELN